jgi:hypothetical protein
MCSLFMRTLRFCLTVFNNSAFNIDMRLKHHKELKSKPDKRNIGFTAQPIVWH